MISRMNSGPSSRTTPPEVRIPGRPDGDSQHPISHEHVSGRHSRILCAGDSFLRCARVPAQLPQLSQETQPRRMRRHAGSPQDAPENDAPQNIGRMRPQQRRQSSSRACATRRGTSVRAHARSAEPLRNRKRRKPSRLRKSRESKASKKAPSKESATGKPALLQSRPRIRKK